MIQENYITLEQAIDLKYLGMPQEEGLGFYQSDAHEIVGIGKRPARYIIYTLSLVQKWLREEKNLIICIDWFPNTKNYGCTCSDYFYTPKEELKKGKSYKELRAYGEQNIIVKNGVSSHFHTYEQALSAGIDKCIELLKQ